MHQPRQAQQQRGLLARRPAARVLKARLYSVVSVQLSVMKTACLMPLVNTHAHMHTGTSGSSTAADAPVPDLPQKKVPQP